MCSTFTSLHVCAPGMQEVCFTHLCIASVLIQPLVRQLEHLCCRTDKDGNTPLHIAAMLGNVQAMDYGLLSTDICDDDDIDFNDEEEEESEVEEEELEEEEEEEEVGQVTMMYYTVRGSEVLYPP